jgi:Holliday junction resolvase
LIGDFGEGLVTYALIRKGFEVAVVDHVGADLIAEKGGMRFAVSVKTRLFKSGSQESRGFVAEELHLKKLDHFANQFGMTPLFALLVSIADEKAIHLMIARAEDIRNGLPLVKHGYSYRFSESSRQALFDHPFIDYSCWAQETIGGKDFVGNLGKQASVPSKQESGDSTVSPPPSGLSIPESS